MSDLPGMWDESDLQGGEADSAEDLMIVKKLQAQLAALKEENERLNARVAELESERDDDQLLNKYAVCVSGSVTQYVYSRVNCDAQSVYDRLVDRHHYNPNISVHFVACEVERAALKGPANEG